MSEASKKLVMEHQRKLRLRASDDAVTALAEVMDELCTSIFEGAEKIREYARKAEIDREEMEVAAYVGGRARNLRLLKK